MKKLYPFIIAALALFIFSCSKQGSKAQQNLILGKWNMQKQYVVTYVNNVKQSDKSLSKSDKTSAFIQFNKDGSYFSISHYFSGTSGNINTPIMAAQDSLSGSYDFSGGQFNMTTEIVPALVSGLMDGSLAGFGSITASGAALPTLKLISENAQILQLTSSLLTLHTEITISETADNVTNVDKQVSDFYFTR